MSRIYWMPSLAVLIISVVYGISVTSGVPLSDEWRWLKELLIPLKKGEISFGGYILGEYSFLSHSHFLTLLFLWFDEKFLQLNFSWFAWVGLFFYSLGLLLLSFYLRHSSEKSWQILLPVCLIVACAYGCTTTDFPWLLVVFEYVYFFLAILLLVLFDLYVRRKLSFGVLLGYLLFCFIFAETIGITAVLVVMVSFTLLAVFKQESWSRLGVLIACIAGFLALQFLLLGKGVPLGAHSRAQTILALLNNPSDVVLSFFSIFTQPLLDRVIVMSIFGQEKYRIFQFALGILLFQMVAGVTYLWVKRQGYRLSILPILLILYSLISWALILMSRYLDAGTFAMDAQRYVRSFTFIYVAVGLMFLFMKHDRSSKYLLSLVTVVVCGAYFYVAFEQYSNRKYLDAYFDSATRELQREPVDAAALAPYIDRCKNDYCAPAINYMKEHNLGVFR